MSFDIDLIPFYYSSDKVTGCIFRQQLFEIFTVRCFSSRISNKERYVFLFPYFFPFLFTYSLFLIWAINMSFHIGFDTIPSLIAAIIQIIQDA